MTDVTMDRRVRISQYLIKLRDSGEVNMFGASPYLMREFGLDQATAREELQYWMEHYKEPGL